MRQKAYISGKNGARGQGGHIIGCDVSVSLVTVGTILSSLPQRVSERIAQIPTSPVT